VVVEKMAFPDFDYFLLNPISLERFKEALG
jgi:hypothetical protein